MMNMLIPNLLVCVVPVLQNMHHGRRVPLTLKLEHPKTLRANVVQSCAGTQEVAEKLRDFKVSPAEQAELEAKLPLGADVF